MRSEKEPVTEAKRALAEDAVARKKTDDALRLLASAVAQAKESILITDAVLDLPGPRILFVNPAFTKMTGYSEAEVIGKTPRILQGARTDPAVLDQLRSCLRQGEVFAGETVNYRKDGTAYDQEWQITPVRDGSGTITNFVALQRDVTERKRAEEALRRSEALFRTLVQNSWDAFHLVTPDGTSFTKVPP